MPNRFADDRGASLIEYAMLVLLIALGSLGLVANLGESTSTSFDTAAGALTTTGTEDDAGLTPQEKWDKAKDDYNQAIADAKAEKVDAFAAAKTEYQAALQGNKKLPKAEKKTANAAAKDVYNAAKQEANEVYKTAVQTAKDAKTAAKAEYNASK